ncbi:MAG: hypothetical protein HJJLKODD_02675 [Phycisphaerae bacterium]|nr:hypothetical protein [Phycisphaerae bacterium]
MTPHTRAPDRQQTIQAIATFAALMHAVEKRQADLIQQAQAQLRQLGVQVRLTASARKGRCRHD